MKSPKPAQMNSDLLVSKGAATAASTDRESLGPNNIELAVTGARAHAVKAPAAVRAVKTAASKPKRGGRISLSVRLDPDRHRRLKLATIHLGETAQNIVIMALDTYLDQIANDLVTIGGESVESDAPDKNREAGSGERAGIAGLE